MLSAEQFENRVEFDIVFESVLGEITVYINIMFDTILGLELSAV